MKPKKIGTTVFLTPTQRRALARLQAQRGDSTVLPCPTRSGLAQLAPSLGYKISNQVAHCTKGGEWSSWKNFDGMTSRRLEVWN